MAYAARDTVLQYSSLCVCALKEETKKERASDARRTRHGSCSIAPIPPLKPTSIAIEQQIGSS
jgi:hypothetical protein